MLFHKFSPLTAQQALSLQQGEWLLTSKGVYVQFVREQDGMLICTEHCLLSGNKLSKEVVLEGEVVYCGRHLSKIAENK